MQDLFGALTIDGSSLPERLRASPPGRPFDNGLTLHADRIYREAETIVALRGQPRAEHVSFREPAFLRRLLAWYAEEGPACLVRLRGPFALAIIEARSHTALLAVDRMGIETLSWSLDGPTFLFGTSAATVAGCLSTGPTLDRQALFDFMFTHTLAAPNTAYVGVHRLPAGTCLELKAGAARLHRYWKPEFRHAPRSSVAALADEVLPTIRRAVGRCEPSERTGSFLSGGLDSSTVTGVLAESRGGAADAFSVAFGVDEYNELSYARVAARRFRCHHHVYEVVPTDIIELLPTIAAAYDAPFGNSSAVPTFCCARFAKAQGMDHLLAGDGGDELFGGNARYVRHKVFEAYGRLPRLLRTGLLEPLETTLNGRPLPFPVRKLVSYVEQARIPLPERFETWNLFYREGVAAAFDPSFLASIDTERPMRMMREVWEACPSSDLLDRMLWYDWKFTLADNDLRKVSRMCELTGINVSYPMLDEEVIDLSIKVPSADKVSGRDLRTFFKRSMRGFLPEEILAKQKHGFGLPFGQWLKTHAPLQELVYDSLASLKDRRILSRSFIDRVTDEHRAGHAAYYGYPIWDMAILELWLQTHAAPASSASRDIAAQVQSQ
jgi:asparagine synthase (glutamine-hydrolysing)